MNNAIINDSKSLYSFIINTAKYDEIRKLFYYIQLTDSSYKDFKIECEVSNLDLHSINASI